jgi:hypothetical protein
MDLIEEFERLKTGHRSAVPERVARGTLGASVMRVFAKGTRDDLRKALLGIPVEQLREIRDDDKFRKWFEVQLRVVGNAINLKNKNNARVQPGAVGGHGTKVLTIFLREMVAHTRFFKDGELGRIERLLYVPLDRITMDRLLKLGVPLPFRRIREIDSARKFYDVQSQLATAAKKVGIPPVWFDDNWGDRQED